jgi:hypothetical protein
VILAMSREDYNVVLEALLRPLMFIQAKKIRPYIEFLNRLNSGKPNYTPQGPEVKK